MRVQNILVLVGSATVLMCLVHLQHLALSWIEVEVIIVKEIKLLLMFLLIMRLIMPMIVVQDMLISGGSSSQRWFKCFTHSHCRLIRTHFQVKLHM